MALTVFLFGVGFGILATGWRLHRQEAAARRTLAETLAVQEARTEQLLAWAPDLVLRERGDRARLSGRRLDLFSGDGRAIEAPLSHILPEADLAVLSAGDTSCGFRLMAPGSATVDVEAFCLGTDADGWRRWALRLQPPPPVPVVTEEAPAAVETSAPDVAPQDPDRATFSLTLFVDECVAAIAPAAAGKRVDIKVELAPGLPVAVLGDEKVLRRLVLRLLDDVVADTPQGLVKFALQRSEGARIRFEASGAMHPDTALAPFGPPPSFATIAADVAELGGASGTSRSGGRWFELDLPAAPIVARPRKAVAPAEAGTSLRILVVEDDALNREMVCQMLATRGHAVDTVPDGGEAIMALQQSTYDLVLMDVQMPTVDGLTATQVIRNLGLPARFTPIVAMTAAVLTQQIHAARRAGMDAVLPKPVSIASLEQLLERAVRDQVRAPADPGVYDAAVAGRLAGSIGAHKVVEMQKLLARTLCARFTQVVGDETVSALKADAHACIPGAAMLGFTRLSERCRLFIDAQGLDSLEAAYAALRQDLYNTVRMIDLIVREDEAGMAA